MSYGPALTASCAATAGATTSESRSRAGARARPTDGLKRHARITGTTSSACGGQRDDRRAPGGGTSGLARGLDLEDHRRGAEGGSAPEERVGRRQDVEAGEVRSGRSGARQRRSRGAQAGEEDLTPPSEQRHDERNGDRHSD